MPWKFPFEQGLLQELSEEARKRKRLEHKIDIENFCSNLRYLIEYEKHNQMKSLTE
jgi:hypothetical protein